MWLFFLKNYLKQLVRFDQKKNSGQKYNNDYVKTLEGEAVLSHTVT